MVDPYEQSLYIETKYVVSERRLPIWTVDSQHFPILLLAYLARQMRTNFSVNGRCFPNAQSKCL